MTKSIELFLAMPTGAQIFYALLVLFLLEQVIYCYTGSFPYRYGFIIRTVQMPDIAISDWEALKQNSRKMSIKINKKKEEVYLRNTYPPLTWGPLLFIGQIIHDSPGVLKIRVGHVTAIFLFYLVVGSLLVFPKSISLSDFGYEALNLLCIIAIIGWLYLRFWNGYNYLLAQQLLDSKEA